MKHTSYNIIGCGLTFTYKLRLSINKIVIILRCLSGIFQTVQLIKFVRDIHV